MRRSSLGHAAVVAVLAAFAGAAVGAALRPAPPYSYLAEAVISIRPDAPPRRDEASRQRARWRRAATVLELPQVRSQIALLANLRGQSFEPRLSARGSAESGLFVVRARGETAQGAVDLAAAAVSATLEFLLGSAGHAGTGSRRSTFDFETGAQDWGHWGAPAFLMTPASLRVHRGGAFAGRRFLQVSCAVGVACGASVRLGRPFSPGSAYTATAAVRATGEAVPLRLVLGGSPTDVARGTTARAARRWTRIAVTWRAQALRGSAELDIELARPGPARFDVDQVVLRPRAGAFETARPVKRADRYVLVGSVEPSGRLRARTPMAAATGGAIGLATALGGLGFGWLARRRGHQSQQ